MPQGLAAQSGLSLLQQPLSCAKLRIGHALSFMPSAAALDIHAQKPRGGLDLPHGRNPMALVIMVGLREGGVSLDEQIRSRRSCGNQSSAQAKHRADNGQTDGGADKIKVHIIYFRYCFRRFTAENG